MNKSSVLLKPIHAPEIPFEKLGITVPETYRVHDLLSGESYRWQGEWNYVQLNPYQMPAHILKFETL
jgi:starch synthase (maltosyl-transferring)